MATTSKIKLGDESKQMSPRRLRYPNGYIVFRPSAGIRGRPRRRAVSRLVPGPRFPRRPTVPEALAGSPAKAAPGKAPGTPSVGGAPVKGRGQAPPHRVITADAFGGKAEDPTGSLQIVVASSIAPSAAVGRRRIFDNAALSKMVFHDHLVSCP